LNGTLIIWKNIWRKDKICR